MLTSLEIFVLQTKRAPSLPAPLDDALAEAILALAGAAKEIADLASYQGIGGASLVTLTGQENEDGDDQKQLDVMADDLIQRAIQQTDIGLYFSEEMSTSLEINKTGALGLACDPLDGSSNIDTNLTIGTIFSIFKTDDCEGGLPPSGRSQLAAGMFVYGPQTSLLLRLGNELAAFALDKTGQFHKLDWQIEIPKVSHEFAINASNAAFWPVPIQSYINGLCAGEQAQKSGMRWLGSLVADAMRIFRRGGIFLYPQDSRANYEAGRLRLAYEANPIAFLIEAAGGIATTGAMPILDVPVTSLHQRVPLIFGSSEMVEQVVDIISQSTKGPTS